MHTEAGIITYVSGKGISPMLVIYVISTIEF
jgi:hypothetical protein